jgi:hypothetical protein
MMDNRTLTDEILDRLESATTELHAAQMALIQFSRTVLRDCAARAADDDNWLRLPSTAARCPISGWSRSSLNRRIAAGDVRKKKIQSMAYYSGTDVRKYISREAKSSP